MKITDDASRLIYIQSADLHRIHNQSSQEHPLARRIRRIQRLRRQKLAQARRQILGLRHGSILRSISVLRRKGRRKRRRKRKWRTISKIATATAIQQIHLQKVTIIIQADPFFATHHRSIPNPHTSKDFQSSLPHLLRSNGAYKPGQRRLCKRRDATATAAAEAPGRKILSG